MKNLTLKIIDNIGLNVVCDNDTYKILSNIKGFDTLDNSHIGYLVPYIVKNVSSDLYEIGIGEIVTIDKNICIKRIKVNKSSNNNLSVTFPSINTQLYIFANENVFNNLSYNIVYINENKNLDPISAIYLCDISNNDLFLTLPSLDAFNGIVLEFQLIGLNPYHRLVIKTHDKYNLASLDSSKPYLKLVSNNGNWQKINDGIIPDFTTFGADTVSILSDPSGDDYSLQYKLGSDFSGSSLYWDPVNSGLLFGSESEVYAKNIISTTGNNNTIFNNTLTDSDFIVYGDSVDKNLIFHPSGRLGINIPSGADPSTVVHIVNAACKQGIRLENRTACTGANITLYHKPSSDILANDTIGVVSFNAKNAAGNEKIYSNLISKAESTTTGSEKGIIELSVSSGSSMVSVFSGAPSSSVLGYSNTSILLNNGSSITLSNNNNNIVIDNSKIQFNSSSITTTGTIAANNIQTQNLVLPNIAQNTLLTVDDNGNIIASTVSSASSGSLELSIPENKILSIDSNGSITGIRSLDDYFLTENDITWSKYSTQSGNICGRQITFGVAPPQTEFYTGDQIVVIYSGVNYYRQILEVITNNNAVTEILIDQNIENTEGTVPVDTYSISRGGFLTMIKSTDEGIVSDSTSNILSIRPEQSTVFNTNKKDINFEVYGLDEQPALLVKANTGRNFTPSGIYHPFATKDNHIFPIVVTTGGNGISNRYSAANYDYDNSRNLFSGILSNVGTNGLSSYYGTYDQNGNAAEWVEKPSVYEFRDSDEYVAGGSVYTFIDQTIESSGLKSLAILPRSGCYQDVGFRIASLQGITDNDIVSDDLSLTFVTVGDPNNISDNSDLYIEQRGDPTSYSPISISKLGHVSKVYRISTYEITNTQYCAFLNAVAHTDDRGLYASEMASEDTGGILQLSGGSSYDYIVKDHMDNVPVVFVSYISAIRFINWLHNGATLSVDEENVDTILNSGAYYIADIDGSYIIQKNSYRKYWLPNINEWHKAAYYEPVQANNYNGTSTVSVKSSEPYLVASGLDNTTQLPTQVFANLTVSGWLYVDHIIVGDQTIASPVSYTNIGTTTTTTTTQTDGNTAPPAGLDDYINDAGTSISRTEIACVGDTCSYDGKPLRLSDDTITLCDGDTNIPWWCDANNAGPGWFI
jgi:hypothetical protein